MKAFQQIMMGIVVAITALFIQSTLLKFLLPDHFVPNLCLIFVIFLAFNEVSIAGAILVFLIGFVFDISSGVLLGPWSAAFTANFCILSLLSRRIFLDSVLAALLIAFASSVFATAIYTGLLYQFQPSSLDLGSLFVESGVTALLAPILLRFLQATLVKRMSLFGQRNVAGM